MKSVNDGPVKNEVGEQYFSGKWTVNSCLCWICSPEVRLRWKSESMVIIGEEETSFERKILQLARLSIC
jgi:hypothetical protein